MWYYGHVTGLLRGVWRERFIWTRPWRSSPALALHKRSVGEGLSYILTCRQFIHTSPVMCGLVLLDVVALSDSSCGF